MARSKKSIQRKIRRNAKYAKAAKAGNGLAMLLIACIILIFGVVLYRGISGSKEQLAALQATEVELAEQLAEQEERSADLEEQRVYVKTKAYVEEAAKKIGLIYPNEVIFKPAE